MAVALTNPQRSELRQSENYKTQLRAAMFDKAKYWTEQDGASPPGNDRERWARSRNLGADLIKAPSNFESEKSYDQSIIFIKDMPVNPSDDQGVFVTDDVVAYMLTQDQFDTLSDKIFDEQIKNRIGF